MGSPAKTEAWEDGAQQKIRKTHFRGVYRSGRRWKAQIQIGGEQHYLGTYDSEECAAKAYDVKAKELRGRRASTNFDEHGNETLESIIRKEKLRQAELDEEDASAESKKAASAVDMPETSNIDRPDDDHRHSTSSSADSSTMPVIPSAVHTVPTPGYPTILHAPVLPDMEVPLTKRKRPDTPTSDVGFLADPEELRRRLAAVSQSLQHARELYDFQCRLLSPRPDLLDPYLDAVVALSIQYDDILERLKIFHRKRM